MNLVTIYFEGNDGYIKAIVNDIHVPYFEQFGAVSVSEFDVPDTTTYVTNEDGEAVSDVEEEGDDEPESKCPGDIGCGLPGMLSWDVASIVQAETFSEVLVYVRDYIREDFPKGFEESLEDLKIRAITLCEEHRNG